MTAPPRARNARELLDGADHDQRELEQSLSQVAAVNRWLGGERSLIKHLEPLLRQDRSVLLLDVGTGSAELPRVIIQWARRHGRKVQIVAVDVHPQMLAFARSHSGHFPEVSIQNANALRLPYGDRAFDAAIMSLTLHHFEEAEQLMVLRELARVSRDLVIVSELRRSWLNYLGARVLAATLWRSNRLTRHDGPLSVLRAFTPGELMQLCQRAGLRGRVFGHFFQRLVLVAHA